MNSSDVKAMRLLINLMAGDPVEAMEAAKAIIASKNEDVVVLLTDISENKRMRKWARIGAVYALGFSQSKSSALALAGILGDRNETVALRCHVAEALGNLRDPSAVVSIEKVVTRSTEPSSLRRWCIYALSEISTPEAINILAKLKESKLTRLLSRELELVLKDTE